MLDLPKRPFQHSPLVVSFLDQSQIFGSPGVNQLVLGWAQTQKYRRIAAGNPQMALFFTAIFRSNPYDSARQLISVDHFHEISTSAASTHHFFSTSYQPFVAAQARREAHRLCVDLAALFGQALGHVSHLWSNPQARWGGGLGHGSRGDRERYGKMGKMRQDG